MKLITLSLAFLSIAQIAYSQDFITQWTFTEARPEIQFSALTTDTVYYTWTASPSGNSGTGSFIQTTADSVKLSGINISAGDTLIISMTPENISRFYFQEGQENINLIDVLQWGAVSWTSMAQTFFGCFNLKLSADDEPDLTSVKNMELMFAGAISFNQEIGDWDVSNVTNMSGLFTSAHSFNQDIGGWDVSNVTDMHSMFYYAEKFNQYVGDWNVSSVTDMGRMFSETRQFNQDIGGWDVSNVSNMQKMFSFSIFDQDIGKWNVSNVTDMNFMFFSAFSFNQDLGEWRFHQDVTLFSTLSFSGMDCDHYSATLIGWQKNNLSVNDIFVGVNILEYGTIADEARDSLINLQGWIFDGDKASDMPCDELVSSNSPQVNAQSQLLIYPNPAQDRIHLPLNSLPYKILNTQGKAVQKGRVEAQRIPVESLPAGVYFFQVRDDQKVYQGKFVKE